MLTTLPFLACLPLLEADLPAVLALDERCLGGLWTYSGYRKELESDCSDLLVLVRAATEDSLTERVSLLSSSNSNHPNNIHKPLHSALAAGDPTLKNSQTLQLLGIGCLWAILEEAHITTLAIEPQYQGEKLGLLLLSNLLLCGRNRGLTRATLEVRASNERALRLYQKFGFKEAGERKRYYADGENARILWRSQLQSQDCLNQLTAFRNDAIAQLQTKHNYKFSNQIHIDNSRKPHSADPSR